MSRKAGIVLAVLIVAGGLVCGLLLIKQYTLIREQTRNQRINIAQQAELIESVRKSSLVFLLSNILDKVDSELANNPGRTLSDATIARIAALSYSFRPYTYVIGDSLSAKKLSPERGQLLLALSKMQIDTNSWSRIMLQTSYEGADLREADLRGADLRGVNLRNADLQNANLQEANLAGADLRSTNLWGASLRAANLVKADLKRAELRWADLNGAKMREADLNGADLSSAQLRNVDFRGAMLKWADASGALFNESDLTGVDMFRTVLRKANFSKANLSEANLRLTILSEATLRESDLGGARLVEAEVLDSNWLALLDEWSVKGAKEIQEKYEVVKDRTSGSGYRLAEMGDK